MGGSGGSAMFRVCSVVPAMSSSAPFHQRFVLTSIAGKNDECIIKQ